VTRARVAAALAAVLTLLLLQAALVGPVSGRWAVSLPAVAVAAVAFVDGPATGMSFGFALGLVADLGSGHPAGVLALTWLAVGLVCGRVADRHTIRHDALATGVVCGLAGTIAALVLVLLNSGGTATDALIGFVPAVVGDLVLAFPVIALVRRMLDSDRLRRPAPVYTELLVGTRR
jgi:rod shape-determining protein MreD